jgi:hypothetical protein
VNTAAGMHFLESMSALKFAYQAVLKHMVWTVLMIASKLSIKRRFSFKFRISITPEMWQETYVSAILRALVADKESVLYPSTTQTYQHQTAAFYNSLLMQLGVRAMNPFPTPKEEARFLEAASVLFFKGDPMILYYQPVPPFSIDH